MSAERLSYPRDNEDLTKRSYVRHPLWQYYRASLWFCLLSLLSVGCRDRLYSDPYPDPGQGKVAVVFEHPHLALPEGTERYFGGLSSLRLVAVDLRGKVVYNRLLRYEGADRELHPDRLTCTDPVIFDEGTYEFFFIANERYIGLDTHALSQISGKRALLRLTHLLSPTRQSDRPLRIPLVGRLLRQLPRARESHKLILITPELIPTTSLLEIHTLPSDDGETPWVRSVEIAYPVDRLEAGLFGYPYSREADRRRELHYYPLTPLDKLGQLYCVGLPEVRSYAPENSRWTGPEGSGIVHLRIQLVTGETKYLPLMIVPPNRQPSSYADYLRLAGEKAPLGPGGLVERFSIPRGRLYRYELTKDATLRAIVTEK